MGEPGWAGVAIGLAVGALISYAFYRLSRERVRLWYRFVDTEIVETKSGPDDPIGIVFEDRSVPRVNKTKLYLWNSGKRTAQGRDIVGGEPLRVTLPSGDRVLRARLLRVTRDVNGLDVELLGDNEALVTFDFLDPGDGAVVEIMHTAETSDRELRGTLKGLPDGAQKAPDRSFGGRKVNVMAAIIMTFAAVLSVLLLTDEADRPSPEDLRVQQIIVGLRPDDRKRIVDRLAEYDALPSPDEPAGWAFPFTGGIFLLGLGMQIYTAGGSRLPGALAEGESAGTEKQE